MKTEFHQYLKAHGSMVRTNPELVRVSKETGYSAAHLFRVAIGDRVPSMPCAMAVTRAVKSLSLTELVGASAK